jgi:2-dehydropantoate 2-reductase
MMRISIIGAGGVGGYFGGRLAQAGNEVTFIARGEHLRAIQENGLIVKSHLGDFTVKPANATDKIETVAKADMVVICTKAWQVKEIAKIIAPLIGKETIVLPLQNGVLAADELSEFIPRQNIVGGLCRIFSMIESPGVINHWGVDPTIVFGELNNEHSERITRLKNTFTKAGITNINSPDIQAELWKKLLLISSGALLAVTRTNYGELRNVPETKSLLFELSAEIYNVAIASGIKLPENLVEKTMKTVEGFPAESTCSLTRDIWEGKPSEIEYQNGTIVRLGEKHGVSTPVNRFVYNSILPMELKARSKSK